jgi:MFS family permease
MVWRIAFESAVGALSIPNYRVFTIGNTISLIGVWIQRVAVGWLAWELTHSGTWLGLCATADLIPVIVISPWAGALSDRIDHVRLIWITQSLVAVQAAVVAILSYIGVMTVEVLFSLTLVLGVLISTNQPSRLALIVTLVGREKVGSAISINSLTFNATRFIGPVVAGLIISQANIAIAFACSALAYIPFLIALSRIDTGSIEKQNPAPRGNIWRESAEGYAYVLRHPGIGRIIILLFATAICLRGFVELLPGFADQIFKVGPEGLGWLVAMAGLGAITGGLRMLSSSGTNGLTKRIVNHTLVLALAVLCFSATARYELALVCIYIAGYTMVVTGVGTETLIQHAVDPDKRGRVLGLYGMIFRAAPAINAIILGIFSSYFGLQMPLIILALASLLIWAWARLRQADITRALEVEAHQRPVV